MFQLRPGDFEPTIRCVVQFRMKWQATAGLFLALALAGAGPPALAGDLLVWRPDTETLDAELREAPLIPALDRLSIVTGWHIYLEPGPGKTITTKFAGLGRGEAMRVLLGDLNYAFVPQPDGPIRLFVFRSSRDAATKLISGAAAGGANRRIPNQLVIKIMPGADIEALAGKIGAKITGRLDKIGVYRLEFDDETARDAARSKLLDDLEVEAVDYNYTVDRPPTPQAMPGLSVAPPRLTLRPAAGDSRVIVGLIDTAVQPLGGGLDAFLLPAISVTGGGKDWGGAPSHGTLMAHGLLTGMQTAAGNQSTARILPVDVFGPNQNTSTYDVAAGILAAVAGGANMLNMSFGGATDSVFLRSVIDSAAKQRIAMFAAAGNAPVTTPTQPAAHPSVYAVTAGQDGQVASFANRGAFVDIIAPGTSYAVINGRTWMVAGTSSATAYATGRAAGVAETSQVSPATAAAQVRSSLAFKPDGK